MRGGTTLPWVHVRPSRRHCTFFLTPKILKGGVKIAKTIGIIEFVECLRFPKW